MKGARRIHYESLNAEEKKIYDQLVFSISQLKPSVAIGGGKINMNDLMNYISFDHPEFFYFDVSKCKIMSSIFGKTVQLGYCMPNSQIKKYEQELSRIVNDFKREHINASQNDYDRARNIHDYLTETIVYDRDAAAVMDPRGRYRDSFSIIGALINRKCVCNGFALAYVYLCEAVGVESMMIVGTGDGGPHAWNIVNIEGFYHHVDSTWDCQTGRDTISPYMYMNISDKDAAIEHTWDRSMYPECTEAPYNYFKMTNSLISTRAQLVNYIRENLLMEEPNIVFKVEENSRLEKEIGSCIFAAFTEAAEKCKYISPSCENYLSTSSPMIYSMSIKY